MPNYVKERNDIGIVRSDGTTIVGLMLAQDPVTKAPIYRTIYDDYFVNRAYSTAADYGAIDPQSGLRAVYDDWRSGFGQEVYDSSNPKRYYSSIGMDLRFKGMGIAGYLPVAFDNTPPTLTDGELDVWTDANTLTNWTLSAGTLDREATTKYSGNFSAKLTGGGGNGVIIPTALTWNNKYRGRTFRLRAWCKCSSASKAYIRLGTDATTDDSSFHTGGGDWEQLSVTHTCRDDATSWTLLLSSGTNTVAYFDLVTLELLDTVTCFAEFNGNLYFANGRSLLKLNTTGDAFTGVHSNISTKFPANITDLEVWQEQLFIALGDYSSTVVEDCEDAWNEQVIANVTSTLDTTDFKVGSGSAKFVVAAGFVTGVAGSEVIPSTDLSTRTGISFWVKSSIDLAANDIAILLDDSVNCGSPLETLNIPALSAGVWTRVALNFATPAALTAVISIGWRVNVDKGACSIWFDDVRATDAYWYMNVSEGITKSTATVNNFKYFKTVHGTAPILWGSDSDNTIRSNTNPINGGSAWSGTTTVGSSFYKITDLITSLGLPYIMKENIPYYLNSSGVAKDDLAPDLQTMTCSTSGKNAITWQNNIYIPAGQQTLLEVDGTTLTFLNPARYCTNLSDFIGRIQALAADEEYLFAIVDNGTKVEVLAGRYETIDSSTSWVWHPIAEITMTNCQTAFVSSIYQKRLWISSTTVGEALYYIPLPTGYGDITNDANRSFKTNTYFITPYYHFGFKGDNKAFIKITATLGHTYDELIYFECWYQKLGDSVWTDAGDLIGTATNRQPSLYIPNATGAVKPVTPMMRFKFIAKTNVTTKTPVLQNYDIQAIFRPTIREIVECEVIAGDFIRDKEGMIIDGVDATYVRTVLTEARDATYPLTVYDIWGNTFTAILLPITPFSVITKSPIDENMEEHFYLRLQKVTIS